MRALAMALCAEGTTDYRFLSPIIRRLAEDLCREAASEEIVITPILELATYSRDDEDRHAIDTVLRTAQKASEAYDILCVHRDGASDARGAYEEWVAPLVAGVEARPIVAVIPIREMEAWAVADGDALRQAFGTGLADSDLGVPENPREVERLDDPKRELDRAYHRVVGPRRRRRRSASADFLPAIGERIRLDRLRRVPAFQAFECELSGALQKLGYISAA